MIFYPIHWLHRVRHAGIAAGSLGAALEEKTTSLRPGENIEVCYLAVGKDTTEMGAHLLRQRSSLPWNREWVSDPGEMGAVKIIVFAYRKTLVEAASAYALLGHPVAEVKEVDLAFLLEGIDQIVIGHENMNLLEPIGRDLGRAHRMMLRLRFAEIVKLLENPNSAEDACWLLNARDRMRGYKSAIKNERFPWTVPLVEGWDVPACEAVHADGHVIVHDGEWRPVKLADFWDRHLSHQRRDDELTLWRFPLSLAQAQAERDRHKPVRLIANATGALDPTTST
ncbi:hypothetical protein JQ604_41150 [Bradyrhizobium jicamae]|uniref:hypothetical protein n=1 Tax=Bradyrhizobium jicamae TaxID=280332 RepID=UPI001BA4B7F2|nr:hypothetical protein [Bradyrhizobium jicamae]MBR0758628.1 hypothetical protein [Bradyrhizobium jicamae]